MSERMNEQIKEALTERMDDPTAVHLLHALREQEETLWLNPNLEPIPINSAIGGFRFVYTQAAQNRFMRFMPYLAEAFPETAAKRGVIESPLLEIPRMQQALNDRGASITGKVYLKDDARMPIAGSVKARGGIHEVLHIAETVAMKEGIMNPSEDHRILLSPEARAVFAGYTIQVGSTGNLGLSIGRTASRMGFRVIVHMSRDAKVWKKELLRSEGVEVREYEGDYNQAVAQGRIESEQDPNSFFIDDENSQDLFFGYSTAALRLKVQLRKAHNPVDETHPMFVYLPCGVGGAPAGITFGLKQVFGEAVHCFFAEPTAAPSVLLGMSTGRNEEVSVAEIGLSGQTEADGLAVGRPSGFACRMMEHAVSGIYTVTDAHLREYQRMLEDAENLHLEISACAGFAGLECISQEGTPWREYLRAHQLEEVLPQATHIVWATGGGLEPNEQEEEHKQE